MMRGAALVAIAAAIGNLLQGWDNATIAGICLLLITLIVLFFDAIYVFISYIFIY